MNLTSGNQTRVTDAENIRLIIRNEDFFVFNRCFMSQSQLEKNPLLLYKWVTQWYPLHASLGIPAVLFWQELRVLVNPGTISLRELLKQFLLSHLDNVYKSTSTLFILFLNTFLFT